jgi:hypothetical protein
VDFPFFGRGLVDVVELKPLSKFYIEFCEMKTLLVPKLASSQIGGRYESIVKTFYYGIPEVFGVLKLSSDLSYGSGIV